MLWRQQRTHRPSLPKVSPCRVCNRTGISCCESSQTSPQDFSMIARNIVNNNLYHFKTKRPRVRLPVAVLGTEKERSRVSEKLSRDRRKLNAAQKRSQGKRACDLCLVSYAKPVMA